jgi:hypothetical protein
MAEHGTRSRYTYELCRCTECVFANATYLRRYRAGDVNREREEARRQSELNTACALYLRVNHPRVYKRIKQRIENA